MSEKNKIWKGWGLGGWGFVKRGV